MSLMPQYHPDKRCLVWCGDRCTCMPPETRHRAPEPHTFIRFERTGKPRLRGPAGDVIDAPDLIQIIGG